MGPAEAVSFMVGQCGLPRGARSATEAEGYVLYAFLNTLPLRLRQFCLPHPQLTGATALAGNLRYADGAMSDSRQEFAERRFAHAWTPSRFDLTRAARLRELLARRPRGRLLDVGCYDGQFISHILDQRDGDGVIGLDVAHAALRAARNRGLRPVRGQVEAALPFASNSFATVVAAEVIEHVFDTQAVFLELARVLQPGGWLALTTPNLVALSGRAQLLLGRSPHNVEFDAGPGTSGHIRYFTFGTLELLLRRAGLRPLGRWTNVTHFSVLGSSELVGRLRPSLGHTLISVAKKSDAHRPRP